MRAVIQRVRASSVTVGSECVGKIGKGLNALIGISSNDTESDVDYILDKIVNMRIFSDENDKMNLSVKDIGGGILFISQFTLYGDTKKSGRRPSFSAAMEYEKAMRLFDVLKRKARLLGVDTAFGAYGENMLVNIENDGPVTIMFDSEKTI